MAGELSGRLLLLRVHYLRKFDVLRDDEVFALDETGLENVNEQRQHDQRNDHRDLGGCGICNTCESGDYLLSAQGVFVPGFYATLSRALLFPDQAIDSPAVASINASRAPPDLARWQFFTRAAIPGRSPSCFV